MVQIVAMPIRLGPRARMFLARWGTLLRIGRLEERSPTCVS
jgi:hypothetical protein